MTATAWRALAAGTGLMISGVLPAFLIASLASRIPDDFAFGDSRVGLAIALFHVMCALISTPAGRLVERIGAVRGMRLAAVATALSCLSIAALAQSAVSLTALLVVGGVANALGGPSVSAMLKREVAPARQGLAFGAQNSGATLGALLAGLALPAVAIPFGWRWAFVLVAGLALAAAALAPAGPAVATAARAVRPRGLTVVHALAVAAALASAAGVGFVSFLVLYAVERGMSQAAAGLLLVAVSLAATAGRIGVGVLADRRGQEPLRPVAAMLAVSIAGYLLLMAGEPALIVIAALVAGGFGWAWPGGLTLAVVQRAPGAPAWAVGVLMAGLFSGAIAGPLLVGVLAEAERFALAWSACAGCALLATCTVVLAALR
jgi:MFS family permease